MMNKILHKLPKVSANMQSILTGNGSIPAYFWIDLPFEIQGIHLQLRCIVCDSTAGHGLLFNRKIRFKPYNCMIKDRYC